MSHLMSLVPAILFITSFAASSQDEMQAHHFEKVEAKSSSEFLNSLGVVSSVSRRGETLSGTIECIEYTGLRWIRAGYESDIPVDDLLKLNRVTGVKFSYGLLSGGSDIERLINGAKPLAEQEALIAIEGANEPNNWEVNYRGENGGGSKSWIPVARLQQDLYKRVKSEPVLQEIPVWSISENGAQTDNTGLQFLTIPLNAGTLMPVGTKYADFANCHNYITHPSWPGLHDNQTWRSSGTRKDVPVDGLYGNYGKTWRNKFKGYSEAELDSLPRVTTETGIAVGQDDVVTEELQARLYLDLYLSQFKRGWKYTAIYLLKGRADEPAHEAFAFYKLDYTPKKAADYLHNFTRILADDKETEEPGWLEYKLSNHSENIHDLLLQRSDGVFQLVIWGENFVSPVERIKVTFGTKPQRIKVYNPLSGTTPIELLTNVNEVKLELSNHPYIIELEE